VSEKIETLCMLVSDSSRIKECTMRRHLSVERSSSQQAAWK
jgi:hypothetical protein